VRSSSAGFRAGNHRISSNLYRFVARQLSEPNKFFLELRGAVSGERTKRKYRLDNQRELLSISVLVKARECMADIRGDLGHGRNAGASTQIDATLAPFPVVVSGAL
jgi:hypothetical protein